MRERGAQHTDFAAKNQIGSQLSIPPGQVVRGDAVNRASPFWRRDRHADRRPRLAAGRATLAAVRGYFEAEGFIEVEPAALQVSPGNETHLHGFATAMIGADGASHPAYLHTSPEFAMKKLLAAGKPGFSRCRGCSAIASAARCIRPNSRCWNGTGSAKQPAALERDCAALLKLAATTAGARGLIFRGREADPFAQPERVSVRDAFLRHAGIDIFESLPPNGLGEPDRALFARRAVEKGIRIVADDSWSDIFSRILSERVEPRLGIGRASVLCEYPVSEAALARVSARDPRVAERFELYVCGVELANAFGELTDPIEQRRRFEEDMALKQRIYGEAYPIDEDFLEALAEMPEASGAALGFDRLVMLACGAERIDDVQWTPVFEPSKELG